MTKKVLTLNHLRNNVDNQCVPIALYVTLQNQFATDPRTKILRLVTIKEIKKWTGWGAKFDKNRFKLASGRDEKYLHELFTGQFNLDDFHTKLNQEIRTSNVTLTMQQGFTAKHIRDKIDGGIYPMFMINPQYINDATQNTKVKRNVRGDPQDIHHFIVIYGYDGDTFFVYDSNQHHDPTEELSEKNIKCSATFGVLKRFSQDINNRLYWFKLTDESQETKIMPVYEK